ncbi:MAG: gamma-glutamyl-gamma-aminobutyrate hydrolase family protein [Pedosphaera sp.]|nr:gamma-glutamyl-gamma-aminobutyrate hydrolase family protein [Pedosphaera sp.]MST00755.1 gamma-glutamyl-gamma-aminobutyrate hydrolase family protein [Pedosphaera sp.]
MKNTPLILITPSTQQRGVEFSDASLSLSNRYARAITTAGGLPWVLPVTEIAPLVAEAVRRSDGVMLTGGDDVEPDLYDKAMPASLRKKVLGIDRHRDFFELMLVNEALRQHKPLLAICRGHQVLNVALGGTLIADIPTQVPGALDHRRSDAKDKLVHDVAVVPGSLLALITGKKRLGTNTSHHQAAGKVAPSLRITATSNDGIIEALEPDEPGFSPFLLGVQFHPERLCDKHKEHEQIFRSFVTASRPRHGKK